RGRQVMTPIKGLAALVCVALASALAAAAGPAAGTSVAATPRLKTISAKSTRTGSTSLVIEASEPVAYVATRPDPLTLQLEFRNATVDASVVKAIDAGAKGLIATVSAEPAAMPGSTVSRVKVALTQPVAHRVRSERNQVIVDFDKPSAAATRDSGF